MSPEEQREQLMAKIKRDNQEVESVTQQVRLEIEEGRQWRSAVSIRQRLWSACMMYAVLHLPACINIAFIVNGTGPCCV